MIARRIVLAVCLAMFAPFAFVLAQDKSTERDRLNQAYPHIMKAGQLAQPTKAIPHADIKKPASELSPAVLKRASLDALHDVLLATGADPTQDSADIYAHMKNAQLRLLENREEPHADHVKWAKEHPKELFRATRQLLREVSDKVKAFEAK